MNAHDLGNGCTWTSLDGGGAVFEKKQIGKAPEVVYVSQESVARLRAIFTEASK